MHTYDGLFLRFCKYGNSYENFMQTEKKVKYLYSRRCSLINMLLHFYIRNTIINSRDKLNLTCSVIIFFIQEQVTI